MNFSNIFSNNDYIIKTTKGEGYAIPCVKSTLNHFFVHYFLHVNMTVPDTGFDLCKKRKFIKLNQFTVVNLIEPILYGVGEFPAQFLCQTMFDCDLIFAPL